MIRIRQLLRIDSHFKKHKVGNLFNPLSVLDCYINLLSLLLTFIFLKDKYIFLIQVKLNLENGGKRVFFFKRVIKKYYIILSGYGIICVLINLESNVW